MPLGPFYELICVTKSEMILPAKNCDESAIRCNVCMYVCTYVRTYVRTYIHTYIHR